MNQSKPTQPENERVSGLPPVRENVPVPRHRDGEVTTTDTGNGEPPPKDTPIKSPG